MAIYFTDDEIKNLDPDFVELLDQARKLSGVTFYIFNKNKTVGTERKETDLRCEDDHARFHIVRALMNAGLNRISLYPDYIHVEYDMNPQNRLSLGKKIDEFTLDT